MRNKANDFFSREEIRQLTQRSDLTGLKAVAFTWAIIIAAFWLAIAYPQPLILLLVVVVLGGRFMALSVLMHEASHFTLMKNRRWNDHLGHWLGAAPVLQHLQLYRQHHLRHHRHTGTEDDPDLRLAQAFPVSKASLRRKLFRDVIGITGLKTLVGSALMLSGHWRYDLSGKVEKADQQGKTSAQRRREIISQLGPAILANVFILAALTLAGAAWAYLLWLAGYIFVYPVVLRVRAIAEHAMTQNPDDALNNARTTQARWWDKLLLAPMNVNYHLEHHMLAAVPWYRLPEMHQQLREKSVFEQHDAALSEGYRQVLTMASSAPQS